MLLYLTSVAGVAAAAGNENRAENLALLKEMTEGGINTPLDTVWSVGTKPQQGCERMAEC